MPREYKLYLRDIIASIEKIEKYIKGLDYELFINNDLIIDGVVRNLEIIGEATKKVPAVVLNKKPAIDWRKIAGLRDILIHGYFGIDTEIIWDIVQNMLSNLKETVKDLLLEEDMR